MTEITQELLDDLRAGKSEAYEQLYNQYYESVYTLTYGILQNYDDAQDAVQQTFIHVFRKLSTLKSDGSFSSWLMRIANNEALMILRKRKRTPVPDEDIDVKLLEQEVDEPMLPATMAERRDTADQLRRMIEKLPYEQRETLVLYYYHQQKITEIAAIMDCSESTAKSRLRYARASVKKEVEQWEKKNGERFRGVVAAPFGEMFVELLQKDAKQKRRRERTWKVILPAIYTTSGSAGYAAGVFTTASSSLIVKIAAGMAACVIAATGIAGIVSGVENGEEKSGSFYGGSESETAADSDWRRDILEEEMITIRDDPEAVDYQLSDMEQLMIQYMLESLATRHDEYQLTLDVRLCRAARLYGKEAVFDEDIAGRKKQALNQVGIDSVSSYASDILGLDPRYGLEDIQGMRSIAGMFLTNGAFGNNATIHKVAFGIGYDESRQVFTLFCEK